MEAQDGEHKEKEKNRTRREMGSCFGPEMGEDEREREDEREEGGGIWEKGGGVWTRERLCEIARLRGHYCKMKKLQRRAEYLCSLARQG